MSKTKSVNGEKLLKCFYYDLYVIKPENIPDAYFQNQVRLARERGYGNIELTEEDKRRMTEEVIDDQRKSLDKWIEYVEPECVVKECAERTGISYNESYNLR